MELLRRLNEYGLSRKDKLAFVNAFDASDGLTYGDLKKKSDALALYIKKNLADNGIPIVVYGHKSSWMLVAFLGCVKAGHPYCPVDTSIPQQRLLDILDISKSRMLIKTESTSICAKQNLSREELETITAMTVEPENESFVDGEDVFYIIFTSGSTGRPKGVEITANDLDNFLSWSVKLGNGMVLNSPQIFLNQAPFSFDLSVMDVYTSLYTGGMIYALDKRVQEDITQMIQTMGRGRITVWVSTPSFMNMCLISPIFNEKLFPELKLFWFCGETLTKHTVREIYNRFPNSVVVNTYGPTESTVAVTQVVVDHSLLEETGMLPIGHSKEGTSIYIMNEENGSIISKDEEKGEIVICGNTLARGYLNQGELTEQKFINLKVGDKFVRAYRTGDQGYYKDGQLYYTGRIDFQVKLHGYRIELGDIESNILELSDVLYCVVLPIVKNGEISGLAAFISTKGKIDDEFEYAQFIRKKLKERIPLYMIPKKFVFLDEMPMTDNGKVNRDILKNMI